MNWSGGKDSALALYYASRSEHFTGYQLLTNINEQLGRVSMHGVRTELLIAQANRLRLPLEMLRLPGDVSMEVYNTCMQIMMQTFANQGMTDAIFGDILLEDLRLYREKQLQQAGIKPWFPLWQRNTTELIHEFVDLGFRAVLVCVNAEKLSRDFVGEELTLDLIKEFPETVDPCGENGEYHSFVYDAPNFLSPIAYQKGEVVHRTYASAIDTDSHNSEPVNRWDIGFWYQDLLLNE